ncbi:MAG: alpha/beta hydrolase, partial [Acidimicrobiales bacterium]|nr:alpha/beta hydrolase [Acidimicrobiales bacterium]
MTGDPEAAVSMGHVVLNGVDYSYLEAGSGPLAVCVHGFPDTAHTWRHLLPCLAEAGFHAVAPFMRGYAPTAVPADGSSPLSAWIADIDVLHDALGGDGDAILVGHDWGALTVYGAASFAPSKWKRVVAAAVPPPVVMATRLLSYEQVRAFWYQYVFLQPSAEMIVMNNDMEFIERLWAEWSPGYDASEDLGPVKDALRAPEHLTAALSTYRTMYDPSKQPPEFAPQAAAALNVPSQPVLYLHGANDGCV